MVKYNLMKQRLLSNWNTWRIIRLALSIVFIVSGFINSDWILLFSGGFLMVHALLNACVTCVGGNCEIPKK